MAAPINRAFKPFALLLFTTLLFSVCHNLPAVPNCGGIQLDGRNAQTDPLAQNTIVNINGILYDVKIQQDAGISSLSQHQLANTINLLNPVAQIPNSVADTASATVKHFISVARAMTLKQGVQNRSSSKSKWLPEAIVGTVKPENSLVISPNPTNDHFDIALKQGNYDIQVFDALGKLVFSKNTEGGIAVDIRTWQNGIYMVSLLDKTSKKKSLGKMVVQH